jgi:uncharacterized membrane protein YeaQ/YmgE (transglycosylase-associated protein family)
MTAPEAPMTVLEILLLLLIAGLAGAIGQAIAGYSRGGCLVSVALGFIGALLGSWIARGLGLPAMFAMRIGTVDFPVIWAVVGAALFVAIVSLLTYRRV